MPSLFIAVPFSPYWRGQGKADDSAPIFVHLPRICDEEAPPPRRLPSSPRLRFLRLAVSNAFHEGRENESRHRRRPLATPGGRGSLVQVYSLHPGAGLNTRCSLGCGIPHPALDSSGRGSDFVQPFHLFFTFLLSSVLPTNDCVRPPASGVEYRRLRQLQYVSVVP